MNDILEYLICKLRYVLVDKNKYFFIFKIKNEKKTIKKYSYSKNFTYLKR